MSLRWETVPYGARGKFVDIDGVGRYLIRPETKGSRTWRAFLNNQRTTFSASGAGAEDHVRHMVERAVAARSSVTVDTRANVFSLALRGSSLDDCVCTIQRALGISTGDVAGQAFSGTDVKTFASLASATERAEFIQSWLAAELLDAAYLIDGEPK